MLTRRSLLQAAAALVTGSAVAPKLIAADPVATEYGSLGRARYIFPLALPKLVTEREWHTGKLVWGQGGNAKSMPMLLTVGPAEMEIPTLLHAHAPIAVVQMDYSFELRWNGREAQWGFTHTCNHWPCQMNTLDSTHVTATVRDIPAATEFVSGTVTVHGIVTKQDAPRALSLA